MTNMESLNDRKNVVRAVYERNKIIADFLKPYDLLISQIEAKKIIKDKLNIDITLTQMRKVYEDFGLKYRYNNGYYRMFVDGNTENYELNNLILVDKKVHESLMNYYKKNDVDKFTGEVLIAALKMLRLKRFIEGIEFEFIATNQTTGEVIKAFSGKQISKKLGYKTNQYVKTKTADSKGNRILKDWVVEKKIRCDSTQLHSCVETTIEEV